MTGGKRAQHLMETNLSPSRKSHKDKPLVSVAMPVFNAGAYLRLAVFSIVKQTFTDWELLIIDDGSTDNALQDIADIRDTRIRIFQDGENRGLAFRLNEAIDLARGQYLARMDQDLLDLIAVRAITIDENDQATGLFPYSLSHNAICARPWRGFYFPHPTWMGRIDWFRKHRYTVPGPYFCEDQELLLRSYRESRLGTINNILLGYRIRGKINWQKLVKTRRTLLRIQLRHFMETQQWLFVLLATLTFAGRVTGDRLKVIRQFFFQEPFGISPIATSSQWHDVLKRLADQPNQDSVEAQTLTNCDY
jgi:glycosyltransferase involved in cell wall biosynthesis